VTRAVRSEGLRVPTGRKVPFTVLDAGCGYGHYLAAAAEVLADAHAAAGTEVRGEPGHLLMGFDLAREAVRCTARTVPGSFLFVNDVGHRICFASEDDDLIFNVFTTRNPHEFARVHRPGGALLVAVPDEEHLQELRGWLPILDIERAKCERTVERLASSLRLKSESTVRHSVDLGGDDLRDLVHMSPSFWHVTLEDLDPIDGRNPLRVQVSCDLPHFRQRRNPGSQCTWARRSPSPVAPELPLQGPLARGGSDRPRREESRTSRGGADLVSGRDGRDKQDAGGCVAHDLPADAPHDNFGEESPPLRSHDHERVRVTSTHREDLLMRGTDAHLGRHLGSTFRAEPFSQLLESGQRFLPILVCVRPCDVEEREPWNSLAGEGDQPGECP